MCCFPCAFASAKQTGTPASIVQSQEWTVHRGTSESDEFTGDVHYKAGPDSASADWALYDRNAQTWQAKGHVAAERKLVSGDIVDARGDEAFSDEKTRDGWLIGKPGVTIVRRPKDGGPPDHAYAKRLDWKGREKATLTGSVHSFGPRLETWSNTVEYLSAPKQTVLSGGRPVAHKLFGEWTGAVKGNIIRAFNSPRRMTADGKVIGWIEFPRKTKVLDKNKK
ncbi:MAG: hypothetical protein ACYCPQ_07370 [Elusimicrobiota bacterium]